MPSQRRVFVNSCLTISESTANSCLIKSKFNLNLCLKYTFTKLLLTWSPVLGSSSLSSGRSQGGSFICGSCLWMSCNLHFSKMLQSPLLEMTKKKRKPLTVRAQVGKNRSLVELGSVTVCFLIGEIISITSRASGRLLWRGWLVMCRWNGGVVSLIHMLPWLVQSACKMFARSSLWAPTRTRCIDVRTVSVICEPGFLLTKTWRHDDMYASWLQRSYICRDGFVSSFWTSLWRGSWFTMTSWGLYRTCLELLDVYELWRAQSSRSSQLAISPSSIYSFTCWTGSLEMGIICCSWEISHRHVAVPKRG